MKIVNKYNLPEVFINYMKKKSFYKPRPLRFSASEMVNPPQIRYLKSLYWDEIEVDPSDYLKMLIGEGVHLLLEKHSPEDAFAEEKLTVEFDGVTLVGKADLWQDNRIEDYKTCSVFAFLLGAKPEWEAIANIYKWLYEKHGFKTEKLLIYAILTDWSKYKAKSEKDYPEINFHTVELPLWTNEKIEAYLHARIADYLSPEPRQCTPEEQWARPEQWAVQKEGARKATRVLDTHEEAVKWIQDNSKGKFNLDIVKREGLKVRCEDYCPVRAVCPQKEVK